MTNTGNVVLWIVVIALILWVMYLQFNTVKSTTGFNSYLISAESINGNVLLEELMDETEFGEYGTFLKVYNKGNRDPWYTHNNSLIQMQTNLPFDYKACRSNTSYNILTDSIFIKASTSLLPNNMLTTNIASQGEGVDRIRILSSDNIYTSDLIRIKNTNRLDLVVVGLCNYTDVQGYREHIKHLAYILNNVVDSRRTSELLIDCMIFRDHLEILMLNQKLRNNFRLVSNISTNKLHKQLNWLVVGTLHLRFNTETSMYMNPDYVNPKVGNTMIAQLSYIKTGGVLNSTIKSTNQVANFNAMLKNPRATGGAIIQLDPANINNLSPTTISQQPITTMPLILPREDNQSTAEDQFDQIQAMTNNTITTLINQSDTLTQQQNILNNIDQRITALENGN